MSLETYTNGAGEVFKIQHPPGLSINDADVTTETVNKANSSTTFNANDVVEMSGNTSAGETWIAYASLNLRPWKRYGHVVTTSLGGVATMDIKRHPRVVMPSSCTTPMMSTSQWDGNANGYFMKRGDTTLSIVNYPAYMRRRSPYGSFSVTKKTGESWLINQKIYGYNAVIGTLYTNNPSVANASPTRWSAGVAANNYGSAITTAVVALPLSLDAFVNSFNANVDATNGPNTFRFQATTFSGSPNIGSSVWQSADGTQIATSYSDTCQVGISLVVYIDTTTTPTTYGLARCNNQKAICPSPDLWYSSCAEGATFVQCYPDTVRGNGLFNSYDNGWLCLLFQTDSANASPTYLVAPTLICQGQVNDMALDVTLPSPWSQLRIIWSMIAGSQSFGQDIALAPSCSIRTTASAPATGMTSPARIRPRGGIGNTPRYNNQLTYPTSTMRQLHTQHYLPVRESRNIPYVFGGYRMLTAGFASANNAPGCRGFDVPSSMSVYWQHSSASSIEWCWAIYDYSTGTYTALTAFVSAIAGAATFWSATITPPTLISGDVYALHILTRASGVTVFPGIDSSISDLSGWHSPVYNGVGYGIYPFDVVKRHLQNDAQSSWVAHQGWLWPIEPVVPTPNWGTAPAITYSGGAFHIGALSAPTWTADASVSSVINGNPLATSTNGPTMRFQVGNSPLTIESFGYTDLFSNTQKYATTLTATKLASVSGGMDTQITLYQASGLLSKFGPMSYVKEWRYVVRVP